MTAKIIPFESPGLRAARLKDPDYHYTEHYWPELDHYPHRVLEDGRYSPSYCKKCGALVSWRQGFSGRSILHSECEEKM